MDIHHVHAAWHAKEHKRQQLRKRAEAGDKQAANELEREIESSEMATAGLVGTGIGLSLLGVTAPVAVPIAVIVGLFIKAAKK